MQKTWVRSLVRELRFHMLRDRARKTKQKSHEADIMLLMQRKKKRDIRSGEMLFLDLHMCSIASVVSNSLQAHGPQSTRLLCPWDCLGKSWSGLPTFEGEKKKAKELLPLLSQPPHISVSNQGLGVGKGQGLIHSKINKESSIGCRRDQEVTGDRGKERKEGRTKKRTGGDWKNRWGNATRKSAAAKPMETMTRSTTATKRT